ncbi:MAG: EamA family transporter [Nitrospiria bacterium]
MPKAHTFRIVSLTSIAMIAFAGNSLFCRMALKHTNIDAASFTSVRIFSGMGMLLFIVRMRSGRFGVEGNWPPAAALFVYAAGFSYAYVSLPAGTGALLLFVAVQVTMIGFGLWSGECLKKRQIIGLCCAFGGLVGLLLPGLTAPPLQGQY